MKLLAIVAAMMLGCAFDHETASDTKFIASNPYQGGLTADHYLINKVHNDELYVLYGFGDNDGCAGEFTHEYRQQLEHGITTAIKVWLRPVLIKHNIVNKFRYALKDTEPITGLNSSRIKYVRGDEPADIAFIFYCKEYAPGRAHYSAQAHDDEVHGRTIHGVVHMRGVYHLPDPRPDFPSPTDLNRYPSHVLLHELGHAFGLGDTYSDLQLGAASTGGLPNTRGSQPESVMSSSSHISLNVHGNLVLGKDDSDGIKWLYRHYIEKNIQRDECPVDYRYEEIPSGCVPNNLLIFEVKQGQNAYNIHLLLESDPSIDINVRDRWGLVALHYASRASEVDAVKAILSERYHVDNWRDNIEVNATSMNGDTVLHIAARNSRADVLRVLLAHPDIDVSIVNKEDKTAYDYAIASEVLAAEHDIIACLRVDNNVCDIAATP